MELDEAALRIFYHIAEMEDGARTSIAMEAMKIGYEDTYSETFYEGGYFDLHDKVFELCEANGITLDMSEYEGKMVGLPYNLRFTVRHGWK